METQTTENQTGTKITNSEFRIKPEMLDNPAEMIAKGMADLKRSPYVPPVDYVEPTGRLYEPIAARGGRHNDHFAVRDRQSRKIYCADLQLGWDQAARLCDVFEEIRQRSRPLTQPVPEEMAA